MGIEVVLIDSILFYISGLPGESSGVVEGGDFKPLP